MQHGYTKELLHMSSELYVKIQDRRKNTSVSCNHYGKPQTYISKVFNYFQRGLESFVEQPLSHSWVNYKHCCTRGRK